MKAFIAICMLFNLSMNEVSALSIRHKNINMTDDDSANLEDDLDNLMDKYDTKDKVAKKVEAAPKQLAQGVKGGPSAA
jgi:hypothetical protein